MTDLFEETPEALQFCRSVVDNLDQHLLFPKEEFVRVMYGVVATDEVDAHGDAFDVAALDDFARQAETSPVWSLAQHDPRIQPIGRFIAVRRFTSPVSGVSFLAGVSGAYDPEKLPTFEEAGLRESAEDPSVHVEEPSEELGDFVVAVNPTEIDAAISEESLRDASPSIRKSEEHHFRKALDPLTIIGIALPAYLVLRTPFLKKYGERLGEKAADKTIEALAWIKERLVATIAARYARNVIYELVFTRHGCRVQLVVDSNDPVVVAEAVDNCEDGAERARRLLDNSPFLELQKLVYLWDLKAKRWLPLHAASRRFGVITNRPQMIAWEAFSGFSLGGSGTTKASPQLESSVEKKDS